MIISLTGFMGCGKSSVARELAALLCCSCTDLDELIVSTSGRSVPEIFAEEGEAGFRSLEKEVLDRWLEDHQDGKEGTYCILSLGGGTVTVPECAGAVRKKTFCIYLRAETGTLVEHLKNEADGRPMLEKKNPPDGEGLRERIIALMEKRADRYESIAHAIIDIDGKTPAEIALKVRSVLHEGGYL